MAPQAIEISQNGLGDPRLAVVEKGESIRRIPYFGLVSFVVLGAATIPRHESWRRFSLLLGEGRLSA
jgi:hypothetical protein